MFCMFVVVVTVEEVGCVIGVGGHGGSGIHADLDDKYREIVTRVSNYSPLRQPRPVVAVSPRRKAAVPATAPAAAVPRPAVDRGGGPVTVRTAGNHAADRGGGGGGGASGDENLSSGAGGASARRADSSGTGQVQPASVTKCAVCSIL